jgi:hypothetical protein
MYFCKANLIVLVYVACVSAAAIGAPTNEAPPVDKTDSPYAWSDVSGKIGFGEHLGGSGAGKVSGGVSGGMRLGIGLGGGRGESFGERKWERGSCGRNVEQNWSWGISERNCRWETFGRIGAGVGEWVDVLPLYTVIDERYARVHEETVLRREFTH